MRVREHSFDENEVASWDDIKFGFALFWLTFAFGGIATLSALKALT